MSVRMMVSASHSRQRSLTLDSEIIIPIGQVPLGRSFVKLMPVDGGGSLVSYGGWTGTSNTREILRFNISSKTWEIADQPGADSRHSYGMCASESNDKVFTLYSAGSANRNSFLTYDVKTKVTALTSLSSSGVMPRQELVLERIGNYGYVFGGWDSSDTLHNDTLRWALGTSSLQKLNPANPPLPRRSHFSAVLNGKMYVLGGRLSVTGGLVKEFWRYDPVANTWTRLRDYPIKISTGSIVAVNGRLISFGGMNDETGLKSINRGFMYNPDTDTWIELYIRGNVKDRAGHGAAVVNNEVYYFGGIRRNIDGQTTYINELLKLKFQ